MTVPTQRITPVLWCDSGEPKANGVQPDAGGTTAPEVVDFYLKTFPEARVLHTQRYPGTGEVASIDFQLYNLKFRALNAPRPASIIPTPAISFTVAFDPEVDPAAEQKLRELWEQLTAGDGAALMPLDSYPFSELYGWAQNPYGFTWQLTLIPGFASSLAVDGHDDGVTIMPSFMFGSTNVNKAGAALEDWSETFPGAQFTSQALYDEPQGPAEAGSIMFAQFSLAGQTFTAMDAGGEQNFTFTPAVGFAVATDTQDEIDMFFDSLASEEAFQAAQNGTSAHPDHPGAGWLIDDYGISWQVIPTRWRQLLANPGSFEKFAKMPRTQISELR